MVLASPFRRLGAIDMIFPGSHATRSEVFLGRRHSKRVKRVVIETKKKNKRNRFRIERYYYRVYVCDSLTVSFSL